MIPIVSYGIIGTHFRQEVVVDEGVRENGSLNVLQDIRRHLSTQYGDDTPMTGWALQPALAGMWLTRIERAFDANYAPAYIAIAFLIPQGRKPKGAAMLKLITDTLTSHHSYYVRQGVIQTMVDWHFLEDLSADLEAYLTFASNPLPPKALSPKYGVAYSEDDITTLLKNPWDNSIAQCRMVFCGRDILTTEKEFVCLEDIAPAKEDPPLVDIEPPTTVVDIDNPNDEEEEPTTVPLELEPHWEVVVQFPDGRTKSISNIVSPEDLDFHKETAIRYLKGQNLDVDIPITDARNHKVTVVGKKKEENKADSPKKFIAIGILFAILFGLFMTINLGLFSQKDSSDRLASLAKEIFSCHTEMNQSGERYCGDSLYNIADALIKQCSQLSAEGQDSLKLIITERYSPFAYNEFENSFNDQTELKQKDSIAYLEGLSLLDKSPKLPKKYGDMHPKKLEYMIHKDLEIWKDEWNSFMTKNDRFMSQSHVNSLNEKFNQTIEEFNKQINYLDEEEEYLYRKCTESNATVADCNQYLKRYKHISLYADHVAHVEKKLKEKEEEETKKQQTSPKDFAKKKQTSSSTVTVKKQIRTYTELWDALIWENFGAKGWNSFNEKYEFVGNIATSLRTLAIDIIDAATKGKGGIKRFHHARNQAEKETTSRNKLKKLEDLLQ